MDYRKDGAVNYEIDRENADKGVAGRSGHFGHKGRVGIRGGSAKGNGSSESSEKISNPSGRIMPKKPLAVKDGLDLWQRIKEDTDGKITSSSLKAEPIVLEAEEMLKRILDENGETSNIETPQRHGLRREIAKEILKRGAFSGKDENGNEQFDGDVDRGFVCNIVIGAPAGGKSSTIVNRLSQNEHTFILDSDEIKKMLPEFGDGNGAGVVHQESVGILENIVAPAFEKGGSRYGDNVTIAVVGKNKYSIIDWNETFKRAGYKTHLYFNDVTADNSAKRAVTRYLEEGRYLSVHYIDSIKNRPKETYDEMKRSRAFETYTTYDNNVPFGTPPKRIERINKNGEEVKWEDWMK